MVRSVSGSRAPFDRDAHNRRIAPLGGLTRATMYDAEAMTGAARRAFATTYFEDKVDADRALPEPERIRRAAVAKKLHYTKMAYRSAEARRAKKARRLSPPDSRSVGVDRPESAASTHDGPDSGASG